MKKIYPLLTVLCGITFSSSVNAQLEYKDVAHIFYSRCTSCHHEGQHGQSMMNYSETFPWAASIKHDLLIGKMPPWSPDTSYSRFDHERIITQSEKNDIIIWIDGGALKGDTSLAPIAPIYAVYKLNGTPDAILKIPVFTSNASSVDSYVCFSIPSGLTQDRILRAYEIVPGNPAIVHHVLVNVDTSATTTSDLSGGCFTISGDFGIGGYAPGAPPTVFPGEAPLKAGIRIKAGSKMVLQIHYPTGTAGQIDSTQIRLYYYPLNTTGVRPIYNSVPLQNWSLYFPPNTTTSFSAHYPSSGTILAPLSMFAAFPHSHKVCTSIVNYACGPEKICLIAKNGFCVDTLCTDMVIDEKFVVPNIFSPDGDGINDLFYINYACLKEYDLTIFDRWGLKIFETTSGGWDGRNSSGVQMSDGTYYYILKAVSFVGPADYSTKGFISLVRKK